MGPLTAAILIGGSILSSQMGSKSKPKTTTETQTTNTAPWSGLQPYLTGNGLIPSYLTRMPEVSDEWLARLQALGAGQLPSGGAGEGSGYQALQGPAPAMIDTEKEKKKSDEEDAKKKSTDTKSKLNAKELDAASRLFALNYRPQLGVLQNSYDSGSNLFGGSSGWGQAQPAVKKPTNDELFNVYQQYLGARK